jgi:hypothetical protein
MNKALPRGSAMQRMDVFMADNDVKMSDKLLFMMGGLGADNFPNGVVRISDISVSEARERIAVATAADGLIGSYPFKSVPDERLDFKFKEQLTCLNEAHDIAVTSRSFFTSHTPEEGGDEMYHPTPGQFFALSEDMPILVMSCGYTMDRKGSATNDNPLGAVIAPDSVKFRLVELVSQD